MKNTNKKKFLFTAGENPSWNWKQRQAVQNRNENAKKRFEKSGTIHIDAHKLNIIARGIWSRAGKRGAQA